MRTTVSITYEIQTDTGADERMFTQDYSTDELDKARQMTVTALTSQRPDCKIKAITTNTQFEE